MLAKWIWLSPETHPDYQKTRYTTMDRITCPEPYGYCVAEFQKSYTFESVPNKVELEVSADTFFMIWVNGELLGTGPVAAGGDFLCETEPLNWYYKNPYVFTLKSNILEFRVLVRLSPIVLTEYTRGKGGLYIAGKVKLNDGEDTIDIGTDDSWLVRKDTAYVNNGAYDATLSEEAFAPAVCTNDNRVLSAAEIKMLDFDVVLPEKQEQQLFYISEGQTVEVDFDMVYAAHTVCSVDAPCELVLQYYETPDVCFGEEQLKLISGKDYYTVGIHSVGGIKVTCRKGTANIRLSILACHYPFGPNCNTVTSDKGLNDVFRLCKWTLGICRQTIHLDSPKHQELLACTGDYFIESMMTLFTYGDMSLAKADVIRTANWLVQNNGRMFHTTYSLIWVRMIGLVYLADADCSVFSRCRDALNLLLNRFAGYTDENGIIVNPPDYMFVDWMVTDGYTLHHPPRYLGQTVLNAFYYGALSAAVKIGEIMGWPESEQWAKSATLLKASFDSYFYDSEKRLYFEGIDDTSDNRRSFARYANILAPLYGLCDEERAKRLLSAMADDETPLAPIQPYFMNFLLTGLEKYGMLRSVGGKLLKKWIPSTLDCSKGLQEGWYKPEDGYSFDHSHAWGGCPAYFIPKMLTGCRFDIGRKSLTINPNLCGLDYFRVQIPAAQGIVEVEMKKGEDPKVFAPDGIEVKYGDYVV